MAIAYLHSDWKWEITIMKLLRFKRFICLSAPLFVAGTFQGFAVPANITIADGVSAGTFFNGGARGSAREDNETEQGTLPGQMWDLESMLWDRTTKRLTIVGGFNYGAGGTYSTTTFNAGDIFIDVNGGMLSNPQEISGNQYNVINGNQGYDFVIHFNDRVNMNPTANAANFAKLNSFSYEVRDLRTGTVELYDALYGSLNESSPFIWKSGGTRIGSTGTPAGFASFTSDVAVNTAFASVSGWEDLFSESGAGNHNHYALSVNLNDITSILGVTLDEAKFSIGCGNDMIKGDFNKAVPDGGTSVLLLGFALGSLSLAGRYARNRAV